MEHTVSSDAVIQGNVAVVGTRLDGRLAEVVVQANQFLRAGDVIARLEDDSLQAKLLQAKIEESRAIEQVEVERALLGQQRRELQLKQSQAEAEIASTVPTTELAKSIESIAARQHQRIVSLDLPTAVSESEKDALLLTSKRAEQERFVAKNDLLTKRLLLQEVQTKLDGLSVQERRLSLLEKDVELARARIAVVEADIEASIIRSPVDGWVGSRAAGAGTSVRVGDPIVSVLEDGPLWLEAWVAESALGKLAIGQTVDVQLRAHPDAPVVGVVKAIGVLSNQERMKHSEEDRFVQTDNKIGVRIAIESQDLRLLPGLTAVVGIQLPESESTELIGKLRTAMKPIESWLKALGAT